MKTKDWKDVNFLEKNMNLLGVSAVEDKLQEDMTDTKAMVGILFSVVVPKKFNKNDLFQHTGNIFVCRYD